MNIFAIGVFINFMKKLGPVSSTMHNYKWTATHRPSYNLSK